MSMGFAPLQKHALGINDREFAVSGMNKNRRICGPFWRHRNAKPANGDH
jgi:hypothetical protein